MGQDNGMCAASLYGGEGVSRVPTAKCQAIFDRRASVLGTAGGRVQDEAFFLHADASLQINCQGRFQGSCRGWLNLTHKTETSNKLSMNGSPGSGCFWTRLHTAASVCPWLRTAGENFIYFNSNGLHHAAI